VGIKMGPLGKEVELDLHILTEVGVTEFVVEDVVLGVEG
jgi:hypothetical protein